MIQFNLDSIFLMAASIAGTDFFNSAHWSVVKLIPENHGKRLHQSMSLEKMVEKYL